MSKTVPVIISCRTQEVYGYISKIDRGELPLCLNVSSSRLGEGVTDVVKQKLTNVVCSIDKDHAGFFPSATGNT
jgi:hypothetical protein